MRNSHFSETEGGHEAVWKQYQQALAFNESIGLSDTVATNEDFFIGKQWEGVQSNGLPTPVFNFLKRVTLFQVASITTDNIKMQASPLSAHPERARLETLTQLVNREFESLFEHNKIVVRLREYMRNAAVDGDGCLYSYWDSKAQAGQLGKGAIVTEIIENTRVFFGNPNDRHVQKQPWILISSREYVKDTRRRARENGSPHWQAVVPDDGEGRQGRDPGQEGKVTLLLRLRRDPETGTIWAGEYVRDAVVKPEWDMGLTLYPITWINWDYAQNCYHGQAMITGLIPNQVFVNKLFAMAMISLMTTAYPKIVYDRTRVARWDNRVGSAIGIAGGDVNSVAKIIDPATVSPQISQFIDLAVNYTQNFLGATPTAMGEGRPDNTSAIIALQRASAVPNEITKQNLYQSIEDLGRIYMDFMGEYYGKRLVSHLPDGPAEFDFAALKAVPMSIKLDVGASSYWSEVASMQTLDNLLTQGLIDTVDYLERVPEGYISKKQELIATLKAQQGPGRTKNGA